MKQYVLLILIITLGKSLSHSQDVKFSSEFTFGHRSVSYQHYTGYRLSNKWSVNNVTLFDSEYRSDSDNIFFIRNMLSYSLTKSFRATMAFGVKNPGGFLTTSAQYVLKTPRFRFNYNIGTTYQNGFTLEQSLIIYYTTPINEDFELFTSLFTVVNTNLKYLDRGIQQLRIGMKKKRIQMSLAINLDQFKKAAKRLENIGIAIKYNF